MKKIYVYNDERIIVSGDEGFSIVKKINKDTLSDSNITINDTKSNNGKLPKTGSPINAKSVAIMSLISIALGSIIIKKYK